MNNKKIPQIIKYISNNLKIKKGSIHQSNVSIIDRSTHKIIHDEKNNNIVLDKNIKKQQKTTIFFHDFTSPFFVGHLYCRLGHPLHCFGRLDINYKCLVGHLDQKGVEKKP